MPETNARSELERELAAELDCEIRFDPMSRALYSTDASNYKIEPVGVVIPRTGEDVHRIVLSAAKYGVAILPRGGGTSLAGQAVGKALVIDFSKYLNRILEVNRETRTVRTEPGIYLDQLNKNLRNDGLMFGPDPSTARIATVGGAVGNNSTGAHSILYGMAGDNVTAAKIVTSGGGTVNLRELDGNTSENGKPVGEEGKLFASLGQLKTEYSGMIESEFPRHWRRASGYSLNYFLDEPFNPAKLLAGAEGTLGIATEFTLKLVPRPRHTALAVLEFGSVVSAMEAVPAILTQSPSAVELVDSVLIRLAKSLPRIGSMVSFVEGEPEAVLMVEFYGDAEGEAERKARSLGTFLGERRVRCGVSYALTAGEQADVWGVRRIGLGILMSRRGEYKPVSCIEDVSVPVETLPQYISDVNELIGRLGTSAGFYGHASAGCLHVRPLVNIKTRGGVTMMKELTEGAFGLALKYGGVMSGEHGDGLQRSYLNERLFGPGLYRVMLALKEAFDPAGLLNPGKVVNAGPSDENLRYGDARNPYEIKTYLDWPQYNGITGEVEMCNGQGVCRKVGEGIMCPSFMATRDERDSTRARANALRAVLSGRLGKSMLTGKEMHQTFDLCLSCKACKTECPSGVDAAKMKIEFLARYNEANGISLRDRMFGHIHGLSGAASLIPGLSNSIMTSGAGKKIMSYLGISEERTLPLLSGARFIDWFYGRPRATRSPNGKKVIYFHDTWVSYYQPEVGKAAVRLLEAAGFEVMLARQRACCGRPMLSKGMVEEARESARRNVSALAPFAKDGIAIIGTEPSCILTFRDEYTDLLPGNEDAAQLSRSSYMLDEFLFGPARDMADRIPWKPDARKILYHGHCHQRALLGIEAPLGLLKLAGCDAGETGAGCCGMAGSFGYESEHYAVSKKIGGDRLFPAVKAANDEAVIAASGVSCRHQIEHFTGRKVMHIAEVLASRIKGQ